MGHKANYLGWY